MTDLHALSAEELAEKVRLAVSDPASVGIFYATQEAWDEHNALLSNLTAALEAAEARVAELKYALRKFLDKANAILPTLDQNEVVSERDRATFVNATYDARDALAGSEDS